MIKIAINLDIRNLIKGDRVGEFTLSFVPKQFINIQYFCINIQQRMSSWKIVKIPTKPIYKERWLLV